jgi:hypothetical protein
LGFPASVRNSVFFLFLGLVVVALHVSPVLAQQTPDPQDPQATQPPPAAAGPPAPDKMARAWHGGVMVGLTLQSGVSDSRGLNVGAALFRKWGEDLSGVLELSYAYASVKFGDIEQTVANVQNHRILVRRELTPRMFLLFRPSYKRNTVQQVDYRVEELGGLGFRVVHHEGLTINAVPVIGAVQQRKNIPAVDGATGTAGFLESAEYQIGPKWAFSQFFLYLRDFTEGDDHRVQVAADITGAIRGPVGVKISYTFDRENVVLDASEKGDARIVASATVTF